MTRQDAARILGVDRSANASDVQRAFRRVAKDLHPDRAAGDASRFEQAMTARAVLLAPEPVVESHSTVTAGANMSGPSASTNEPMAPVPTWLWPLLALASLGFVVILGLVLVAAALSGVESTPVDAPTTPVEVVEECVRITDNGVSDVPCGAPEAMRIVSFSELNAACPEGTGKLQVLNGGTYCLDTVG